MRVTLLSLFIIMIVLLTPVASVYAIPLTWRDSGYDLVFGYSYTISLHAEQSWTGDYVAAGFQAGPIKIVTVRDVLPTGYHHHVKVFINNEEVWDGAAEDTPPFTTYEYDVVFTIDVDVNGGAVIKYNGEVIGSIGLDHSYNILFNTDIPVENIIAFYEEAGSIL